LVISKISSNDREWGRFEDSALTFRTIPDQWQAQQHQSGQHYRSDSHKFADVAEIVSDSQESDNRNSD
jgi:hypothetical protein